MPVIVLRRCWFLLLVLVVAASGDEKALGSRPLEVVTFADDRGQTREVRAAVVVEAQDGGVLLMERDGRLWPVDKPQLKARTSTEELFTPLTAAELGKQLKTELGMDFEIVQTKHYVIATSAGKPYAEWCGALFERLYSSFQTFWTQRGIELHEPEFPLAALVFSGQREFSAYALKDTGSDIGDAKGYFHVTTNRMVLFDLTADNRGRAATAAEVNRRLTASPYNVATVVHEATHQIAFNSGMHTRLADNPVWLTEGMAMYFETPDLSSRTGWKTAGAVNPLRQRQFLAALKTRPAGTLPLLLRDDKRITDADTAGDAYAEAWALTFFLIRTRKQEYADYLKTLSKKRCLEWDTPEVRLQEFRAAFGDDLDKLEAEMIRSLKRVR